MHEFTQQEIQRMLRDLQNFQDKAMIHFLFEIGSAEELLNLHAIEFIGNKSIISKISSVSSILQMSKECRENLTRASTELFYQLHDVDEAVALVFNGFVIQDTEKHKADIDTIKSRLAKIGEVYGKPYMVELADAPPSISRHQLQGEIK